MALAASILERLLLVTCVSLTSAGSAFAVPCSSQTEAQESAWALLNRSDYAGLDARLSLAQSSYRAGTINDVKLQQSFLQLCDNDPHLKAKYDAWVAAFPNSYVAHLARGNYLRNQGWQARGDGYADETGADRFEAMERLNSQAKKEYQDSLQLERKPILSYSGLIDMSRHGGSSGPELVEKALKVDPKSFVVRRVYMTSIETRWQGSADEMQDFATESKGYITAAQYHVLDAMVIEDRGWSAERAHDEAAAARLYKSAVDRVEDPSQAASGWYVQLEFETGWAYQQANDLPTAIVWFRRTVASNPEHHHALSNLAWTLQKTGQATEAASYYKRSADLGDTYAQDQYGKCLWFGLGIPKDPPAAVPYFERAAAAGSNEASSDLYWATRQLHLPPRGSLNGASMPVVPAARPLAPSEKDLGPTDS